MRSTTVHNRANEELVERLRRAAAMLVRIEERKTGYRMKAYHTVASRIGAHASWLRKFIGRHQEIMPSVVVGMRIWALYANLVDRVIDEAAEEQQKVILLLRELDGFTDIAKGLVKAGHYASETGTPSQKDEANL